MNHRIPAIPLALVLGLSACGVGQQATTDSGVTATVVDTTVTDTATDPSQGAGNTEESEIEQSAPDSGIARVENDDRRLRSSVLGAAVEQVTQTSARFEAVMTVVSDDPETPGTFSLAVSGGYDLPNRSSLFEMDLSGLAEMAAAEATAEEAGDFGEFAAVFAEPMRVISIGDESWVQGGFFAMFGAEPGMWLAMDSANSDAAIEDLAGFGAPLSPTDFIEEFGNANATVTELGAETIRGTETTHYLAEIDLASMAEMADELSPQERAELDETLAEFGNLDVLAIEFWIDGDDLFRRMELSVDLSEVPDSDGFASMSMTFDVFDYGDDLGITAPDPSLVIDEADLGFGS